MAQVNNRKKDAATYAGVEGTYGTAATTARLSVISDSFEHDLTQDPIPVDCESTELFDHQSPLFGLKRATAKFGLYVRPAEAAPLSTGTVTYSAQMAILKALFGGGSPADGASVGTTATGSPGTATSVNFTSASNFAAGQLCLIETANGLEPARIGSFSTNTATLSLGLSASPSAGGVIANLVNLYPTPGVDSCSSITIEHAKSQYDQNQVRLLGCIGDVEWTFAQNDTLKCMVSVRAANWSRGALSLSTSAGQDTGGTPIAITDGAKLILQDATTATPTHVPFEEVSVKVMLGLAHVPDLGGSVQGTAGIARVGERTFAEWTITLRADEAMMTRWSAQTLTQVALMVPRGTGTSKQWAVFYSPRCVIEGKPKRSYSSDGRERYVITLRSQIDTSLGSALLKAPFIFAA